MCLASSLIKNSIKTNGSVIGTMVDLYLSFCNPSLELNNRQTETVATLLKMTEVVCMPHSARYFYSPLFPTPPSPSMTNLNFLRRSRVPPDAEALIFLTQWELIASSRSHIYGFYSFIKNEIVSVPTTHWQLPAHLTTVLVTSSTSSTILLPSPSKFSVLWSYPRFS